jgi:uncharacterized DUF497 family protein
MTGNGSLSSQGSVFDFDPAKSRANEKKHGISFARARTEEVARDEGQ